MSSVSLDVTKAIQSLKKQVDVWGKKVSGDGCEYSELYCVKLNDLSQILGDDVKGYSIKELCNKVIDKAVDLSSSWEYELKYNLIPNEERPKEIMFEVGHKLNWNNKIDYNEEDKVMENLNNEVLPKRKKSYYTDDEFDYLAQLYGDGEDIVHKYYVSNNSNIKKSEKIKLEAKFKMKYPNHKGVRDCEIWYIFYRTRILPYRSNYKKDKDNKYTDEPVVTIANEPQKDVENNITNAVECEEMNIKQPRNIPIEDYVKNLVDYIDKVGIGSYRIEAKSFCIDVIKRYSYLKNKRIGGLCNKIRECKEYMNKDRNCKYTFTYEQHKIEKIDDLSVNNVYFIFNFKEKDIVEDLSSEESNAVIENIIRQEYIKHNVEFKIGIYQKSIFKSKLLSTLSLNMDFVVEANTADEQLDKLVRDKIAYIVNQSDLSSKYYYSLQQENGKDYNIVNSDIILV